MSLSTYNKALDCTNLSKLFKDLKNHYNVENLSTDKKEHIINLVQKYGHLPISHQKALEELSLAETIVGLEEKFKLNNIYDGSNFTFTPDNISPVIRAGYNSPTWLQKEQLNIKFINLAALGNGNKNEEITGKFQDWLKQILILPPGNIDFGILGTVVYLGPFHPRDFGCAYLPKSKFVSPVLEDSDLKEKFNLTVKDQVKIFIQLCQLAGHPVMYDVLPQTGRYAKTIIANPYVCRWFNIPQINQQLKQDLNEIAEDLKNNYDAGIVEAVKDVIAKSLEGISENTDVDDTWMEENIDKLLDVKRKKYSEEMTSKENQEKLVKYVKIIIAEELGISPEQTITEEDIGEKHFPVIQRLIDEGLWPAPGGAWCSCGPPIYERMVSGGGHPLFKHYDVDGYDVSHFANLDCQTPFYFVYLETGEYNRPVIDFWCNYLIELQQDYNFDAYRLDHVDHVADRVSQTSDGTPISYRVPLKVLAEAIYRLREQKHYFGALAEYMLWDGLLKEYHQQMGFDSLWGNDIVFQFAKNVKTILGDNERLQQYNNSLPQDDRKLSILKNYNNQDGEFRELDQYPAQMGESGALFKWFKFKFLPLTPQAERAVMYADGDESFTKTGLESIIGSEISLKRNNDMDFYRKFEAINRFAVHNIFCRYGISEIHHLDPEKDGLIAWTIRKQYEFGDDERLLVVANENPPHQIVRIEIARDQLASKFKEYQPIKNSSIHVPDGFVMVNEYILPDNEMDYIEEPIVSNLVDNVLHFDLLQPAEFHFYRIKKLT